LYGPKIGLSLAQTKEKLTAKQWIELVAKEIGTEPKIQKIPTWMIHILGLSVLEFPPSSFVFQLKESIKTTMKNSFLTSVIFKLYVLL